MSSALVLPQYRRANSKRHSYRRPRLTLFRLSQGDWRIRSCTEVEAVYPRFRCCRSWNSCCSMGNSRSFSVSPDQTLLLACLVLIRSNVYNRLVTKMVLHRSSASLHSSLPFPPDSTISIYSPLTRLSSKLGQKPRQVPLSKIRLLGPLSDSPKPYHPLIREQSGKKPGVSRYSSSASISLLLFSKLMRSGLSSQRISSFLSEYFPSSPKTKSAPTPWNKAGKRLSHSPILIEGDRASYSIALKRAREMDSDKGAWAKDWDQLERALLGVDEARWSKRQ